MWETGRNKKEKAVLVSVDIAGQKSWPVDDAAGELKVLAESSGVEVIKTIFCHRAQPTPAYLIGKGKTEEISGVAQGLGADVVIFNEDLNSTQQRNLEEVIALKTLDRTQLILDIFSQRAKSIEGKVQVELAQLEYLLPRLAGQGILLSRLGGGIGTRGPGEKKLEVDRRRISKRIVKLKKDLRSLSQRRNSLREHRRKLGLPTIAIIGYTNAGKSTLINRLTGAGQLIRNSLFSTLDSVARKFTLPNKQRVLFSDTVGFLHRLPHHLIEAFKATLEEVQQADVLLHVLDASSPLVYEQNQAVDQVLAELTAQNKPMVLALNKSDLVGDEFALKRYLRDFKNSVAISALKGTNLEQLLEQLSHQLSGLMVDLDLFIPQEQMDLLNMVHRQGQVFKQDHQNNQVHIQARVPVSLKAKIENLLKEQE
ncbi:GTPase HflX [Candidatus Omnitrophota bacterium]